MTKTTQNRNLFAGLSAGLVASAVMGAAAMMLALPAQMGFFTPLRLIASALLGESALGGGVFPVLLGLLLHMMMGALLGVVYAYGVRPAASSVGLGVGFGLLVWVGATLSLRFVAPVMAQNMPYWLFAAAHVVYGATLALLVKR